MVEAFINVSDSMGLEETIIIARSERLLNPLATAGYKGNDKDYDEQ